MNIKDPELEAVLKPIRQKRVDALLAKIGRLGIVIGALMAALLAMWLLKMPGYSYILGAIAVAVLIALTVVAIRVGTERGAGVVVGLLLPVTILLAISSLLIVAVFDLSYLRVLSWAFLIAGLPLAVYAAFLIADDVDEELAVALIAGIVLSCAGAGYLFGLPATLFPAGGALLAWLTGVAWHGQLRRLYVPDLRSLFALILVIAASIAVLTKVINLRVVFERTSPSDQSVSNILGTALGDGGLLLFAMICGAIILGLGTLAVATYCLRIAFYNLRHFASSPVPTAWGVTGRITIPRFADFAFALREAGQQQGIRPDLLERALDLANRRVGPGASPRVIARAVYDALVEAGGISGDLAHSIVARAEMEALG